MVETCCKVGTNTISKSSDIRIQGTCLACCGHWGGGFDGAEGGGQWEDGAIGRGRLGHADPMAYGAHEPDRLQGPVVALGEAYPMVRREAVDVEAG